MNESDEPGPQDAPWVHDMMTRMGIGVLGEINTAEVRVHVIQDTDDWRLSRVEHNSGRQAYVLQDRTVADHLLTLEAEDAPRVLETYREWEQHGFDGDRGKRLLTDHISKVSLSLSVAENGELDVASIAEGDNNRLLDELCPEGVKGMMRALRRDLRDKPAIAGERATRTIADDPHEEVAEGLMADWFHRFRGAVTGRSEGYRVAQESIPRGVVVAPDRWRTVSLQPWQAEVLLALARRHPRSQAGRLACNFATQTLGHLVDEENVRALERDENPYTTSRGPIMPSEHEPEVRERVVVVETNNGHRCQEGYVTKRETSVHPHHDGELHQRVTVEYGDDGHGLRRSAEFMPIGGHGWISTTTGCTDFLAFPAVEPEAQGGGSRVVSSEFGHIRSLSDQSLRVGDRVLVAFVSQPGVPSDHTVLQQWVFEDEDLDPVEVVQLQRVGLDDVTYYRRRPGLTPWRQCDASGLGKRRQDDPDLDLGEMSLLEAIRERGAEDTLTLYTYRTATTEAW